MKKLQQLFQQWFCKHEQAELIHIGNHRLIFECVRCGKQRTVD